VIAAAQRQYPRVPQNDEVEEVEVYSSLGLDSRQVSGLLKAAGIITRGQLTSVSAICLNTQQCQHYQSNSPAMSYLLQSAETIDKGPISHESGQQRCASLLYYAWKFLSNHGLRLRTVTVATVHVQHRFISLTITRFSTSFISIGPAFQVKARIS
jgi:hypothetical protein